MTENDKKDTGRPDSRPTKQDDYTEKRSTGDTPSRNDKTIDTLPPPPPKDED